MSDRSVYTTELKTRVLHDELETYRLIDLEGNMLNKEACEQIDNEELKKIFNMMMRVEETDSLLYMA